MSRQPTLVRSLGLGDATLLVIGCIIGVGIFRTASAIATHVHTSFAILALWVFGGILSLCGALSYAELATMFPKSGGDYVYISYIYGRFWGFLFGWTKLFVERTGTIAILAFVFAEYLGRIIPYGPQMLRAIAAGAIVLLTLINIVGVRWGTWVQNVLTILKVGALSSIVLVGFLAHQGSETLWSPASGSLIDLSVWQSLGLALVFVLWTYGGWTEATYVAEEVKDPHRDIPRAIVSGVLLTMGLYVLVNAIYLWYIPLEEMPRNVLVASTMMQHALGPLGGAVIAGMVACSALGALNGYILTGGRILYAIGQDHALFAKLGTVHPRFRTPAVALAVNGLLAIGVVFLKTLEQIMEYSTVVISVFFTMAVIGVFILRRRLPHHPRPYRTWGFPVTPLVFILTMVGFITAVAFKEPKEVTFGFLFLAVGLPLYRISCRLANPR